MIKHLFCGIVFVSLCLFLGCSDNCSCNGNGSGGSTCNCGNITSCNCSGGGSGNSCNCADNPSVGGIPVSAAKDGEVRTIRRGDIDIEIVFVEAGTFTQGGSDYGNSTSRQVTLTKGFWIGKYEITQAQFEKVLSANPSINIGANNPVESDWFNAYDFCLAIGARLPTEAEWEFAARGGKKSLGYIYSGSNDLNEVGWYEDNAEGTQPVGQKKPNELGIYDMSGNVWEWCNDWYYNYLSTVVTDPTGPSLSGSSRVSRGGSWNSFSEFCRVANRLGSTPSISSISLGFRVAFNSD